jgi:L,D-peptidoglycan transpeptidase YkuD (ErfK/YbiS/YcfS/YnhG family)
LIEIFFQLKFLNSIEEMKQSVTALLLFCMGLMSSVKLYSASPYPLSPGDSLKSGQLIIVLTDNRDSIRAKLYCVEKKDGKWVTEFSFPVVVGEKGMTPHKSEGDLKAPSGIFDLGPAFGYADKKDATWIHMRYLQATDTLICVDDAGSLYYNQLIDSNSVLRDWHSREIMHLKKIYYKWGIFVQYNFQPAVKGNGSCIFIHIWGNENEGTEGCTAMEEKNILKLLQWIRAEKNPKLIQYQTDEYEKIAAEYKLPDLKPTTF